MFSTWNKSYISNEFAKELTGLVIKTSQSNSTSGLFFLNATRPPFAFFLGGGGNVLRVYSASRMRPDVELSAAEFESSERLSDKWILPLQVIHDVTNKLQVFHRDLDGESASYLNIKKENLQNLKMHRNQMKAKSLGECGKSKTYILRPRFGQLIYFELEFTNPWNCKKTFLIKVLDPLFSSEDSVSGKIEFVYISFFLYVVGKIK
ncbi:hypothetical protein RFI_23734 [Reticulomyxa filosa]|uniref:Uncharacterized protein n=1 Tax=Reticulomyxa filosa TaxID=46433 RepID=X6MIC6_RETFI|nr:hypothetical protein RFI_23734 [Reticulomyxa filosa]|eukprot:ETO13634.1 hypothetical protein RFI_23734 [Reticulomyxa filosa]